MHWTWMHVHGHITSWHHSCKTIDQALSHAILDGNLGASALHKLLVSPTNSPRSACITHSYYIFGSHRHIVQLHWGDNFSESVLTWAAIAVWSWASWHRYWRSSTIGEDVLSWWTVNPICYGHWGLRERERTLLLHCNSVNCFDNNWKGYTITRASKKNTWFKNSPHNLIILN